MEKINELLNRYSDLMTEAYNSPLGDGKQLLYICAHKVKDIIIVMFNSQENKWRRKTMEEIKEEINYINFDYNSLAMGCGLEDRDITDKYQAMQYGWDEAIKKAEDILSIINNK